MGFLKNISLLAGGAAVGFVASRVRQVRVEQGTESSQELLVRARNSIVQYSPGEYTLARFFDSSLGQRLQPVALKAMKFAANVKQGMNEREQELKEKFDPQAAGSRPKSAAASTSSADMSIWSVNDEDLLYPETTEAAHFDELQARRLERDRQLGRDFFA